MPKFTSKKSLRSRISALEAHLFALRLRSDAATALATIAEKDNIQLARRIKGLENQLNIKRTVDERIEEFDKSLKHYDWEKKNPYIGEKTKTSTNIHPDKDKYTKPKWVNNPRNNNFPNWEN